MAVQEIKLTNAAECLIRVVEGDKLSATNGRITITDAQGANVDMSAYSGVEFNIYRDQETKARMYQFVEPVGSEGGLTLGDGYFDLLADPFPLESGEYRFGLREMDSPITLAYGDFIVLDRF
jgi:hypothetical protein